MHPAPMAPFYGCRFAGVHRISFEHCNVRQLALTCPADLLQLKLESGLLKDGQMKRARFTEEQIIGVLREHDAGAKAADLARKHGVFGATLYNWKAKYGGMDVPEAKRLRQLEDEHGKLKKLLAEQMLDAAAHLTATCDRLRNPDQLRGSHVAPPAPAGVKPAETLIATG